ncbi:MAG: hypothetical protein AAF756_14580 [Pseudomonadota bacterium]
MIGAVLGLITACGGGGGSGGGSFLGSDPSADLTSFTLQLALVDENGNPTSDVSDTSPATLRVTVLEDNPIAAPVVGEVLQALSSFAVIAPANGQALTNAEGVAEFQVQAGDTLGADTITVTATSPAGDVTATIGVEIGSTGLALGFFDGTSFIPGSVGLSTSSISFRGSAAIRIAVVDDMGETSTDPRQVRFTSACSLSGIAGFRLIGDTEPPTSTLVTSTVDGLVSLEYVATGCEGDDEITATLTEQSVVASATINVARQEASFIGFVSADPSEGEEGTDRTIIALQGTGGPGRPELATLVFEVLEEAVQLQAGDPAPGTPGYLTLPGREPLAGVTVDFELSNTLGGITLMTASGVTDAQGLVEVVIEAGAVATSTRVTASFTPTTTGGNQVQSALSNPVVVGTGLPDQNSVSISAEVIQAHAAGDVDGVEVGITVRMADKFNNPVADGTTAVFATEYGAIDGSCLTGESNGGRFQDLRGNEPPLRGTCSVLWVSQEPRTPIFNQELIRRTDDPDYRCPQHSVSHGPCPTDLGSIRGNRSTITVTAIGDESFFDRNGNGLYDEGEPFDNLSEAFTDHNEDLVFTPSQGVGSVCLATSTTARCEAAGFEETFTDLDENGVFSTNVDPNTGLGVFNGSLCPRTGEGIFCSRDPVNVRQELVLTLSSSVAGLEILILNGRFEATTAFSGVRYPVYIADVFNNAPGTDTNISFAGEDGCGVRSATSVDVPNQGRGAFETELEVFIEPPDPNNPTPPTDFGFVRIVATSPMGDTTSELQRINCSP